MQIFLSTLILFQTPVTENERWTEAATTAGNAVPLSTPRSVATI